MNKRFKWVWYVMHVVGALALCAMMGVTILDIILRSFFNYPIQGAYEIVQLCLVTAVFACLGEAFRKGVHVVVDLIDHLAPRLTKRFFLLLSNCLSLCVLFVFLYGAVERAIAIKGYGDQTIDLKIGVFWYWIPVIFGLSGALIGVLLNILSHWETKSK